MAPPSRARRSLRVAVALPPYVEAALDVLPLVEALARGGADVWCVCAERPLGAFLRGDGARALAGCASDTGGSLELEFVRVKKEDEAVALNDALRARAWLDEWPARGPHTLHALSEHLYGPLLRRGVGPSTSPDVVITVPLCFAAIEAATELDVPVVLVHSGPFTPYLDFAGSAPPRTPSHLLDTPADQSVLQSVASDVAVRAVPVLAWLSTPLANRWRRARGLAPLSHVYDLWRGATVLLLGVPGVLQPPFAKPPLVHPVGPLEGGAGDQVAALRAKLRLWLDAAHVVGAAVLVLDAPHVPCEELLALAHSGLARVLCVSSTPDQRFAVRRAEADASRVRCEHHVPLAAVMQHAAVKAYCSSCRRLSALHSAVLAGVPVVAAPPGPASAANARRLVEAGVAERIDGRLALREAVERVLEPGAGHASRCRALAWHLRAGGGVEEAVAVVADVATGACGARDHLTPPPVHFARRLVRLDLVVAWTLLAVLVLLPACLAAVPLAAGLAALAVLKRVALKAADVAAALLPPSHSKRPASSAYT